MLTKLYLVYRFKYQIFYIYVLLLFRVLIIRQYDKYVKDIVLGLFLHSDVRFIIISKIDGIAMENNRKNILKV